MNASGPAGILAPVIAFLVGAIGAGDINDYLGVAVATTGLFVGVFRYGMVWRGGTKAKVERATAIGFFLGLIASAVGIAALLLF